MTLKQFTVPSGWSCWGKITIGALGVAYWLVFVVRFVLH